MMHRSGFAIRLALLAPVVGLLGWTGTSAWRMESVPVPESPALLADPPILNLGRVTSIQSPVEFKVTNQSSSNVVIQQLRSSCGCMDPTVDRNKLEPGETAQISAVMRHAKTGEGSELPFNRSVTVLYETEGQPASLALIVKGLFLPPVWVNHQTIQFQKADSAGRSISAVVPIFLRADPPVRIKTANVFGRDFVCETVVVDSPAESSSKSGFIKQQVRVRGKALRLPATGSLLITTDAPETPQLSVALACQSDDPFRLACVPPRVAFGVVEPNQNETRRIVVTWATSAEASVEFVRASSGFMVKQSTEIIQQGGRQTCAIEVTASLFEAGAVEGEIAIGLRGSQDATQSKELRVPISGFVRSRTLQGSAGE